jgi:hypothetical protein
MAIFKTNPGLDPLFQKSLAAIDAGDLPELEGLLAAHPELVRERLESPGKWLRDQIGPALNGFFKAPYLLWFVSEDAKRAGKLPPNIVEITRAIIRSAREHDVASMQDQLDYTLKLVAWSGVAADSGAQLELMDVLLDAGASTDEVIDSALVNGHIAAVEHLLKRGAPLTLSAALCLGRFNEAAELLTRADQRECQMVFVLAALNGKATALQRVIEFGIDVNSPSRDLYAHATPLHHAVCSGSLEAVKVLVDAGADLTIKDKAERATPLGWAEYYASESQGERADRYTRIADYLRMRNATGQ